MSNQPLHNPHIKMKTFPGKHEQEEIILVLRRHWLVFLIHIVITVVLSLLPVAGNELFKRIIPGFETSQLLPMAALAASAYYLFVLLYFYLGWVNYYLDVWIVTTERIINIEQEALFKRVVAEQNIFRVQDVTAEVTGLIHTFFDFGNVMVQTAGTKDRFEFEQVPHPYKVKKIIIQLNERKLSEEPYRSHAIREEEGPEA